MHVWDRQLATGKTPSAVPYNGQLDVTTTAHPKLTQLFYGLQQLFAGRFLKSDKVESWRTKHVNFVVTDKAPIAIDGHKLHYTVKSMDIVLQPEAIEFLIPQ